MTKNLDKAKKLIKKHFRLRFNSVNSFVKSLMILNESFDKFKQAWFRLKVSNLTILFPSDHWFFCLQWIWTP